MASYKALIGVLAAGSMFASSTAAVAATASAPVSPWAALTAMSGGAPAATMCGAAAAAVAAAQAPGGCVLPALDTPPPVAQVEPAPVGVAVAPVAAAGFNPLLLALALVAAGVGAYLITKGDDDDGPIPGFPNTPG